MSTNCKFYKEEEYVSYDSGETWTAMGVYRKGDLIEYDSEDCGYVPPTPTGNTKFSASYNNGTSYSAACDNSTILSSGDTHPSGYQASGITSAEIGSCITSIGCRSFYGASYFNEMCTSMTSITIPNSVTSLSVSSFERCISLTSVTIPNSVTYIDDYAFNICSGLTTVTIGNGVTSIGSSAFYGSSGLTNISIPNNVAYIGGNCFYKSRLTKLNSNTNGVFNIPSNLGSYCFYECSGITTLTLENGVTSIGERAFAGCTNLTSVTIPNSVTSVGSKAFRNTPWYSNYSADTSNQYGNIVYINDIAYEAVNKNITNCMYKTNTVTIGGAAFVDCSSLTSVTIPNTVTSIEIYAFAGCTSLSSVTIPNSVTSIGATAFQGCTNLTSVTIPNSVTSVGSKAFRNTPWYSNYSADTSKHYGNIVYINDIAYQAVNTSITSCTFKPTTKTIGDGAFRSCNGMTSVTIPNSVTSIGTVAFGSCTSLTSIEIPSGVTSIGNGAFNACTSLTSVTVEATTPPIIEDDVFNQAISLIIYVPSDSVDAYKTARGWNRYASRIQAIP